MCYDYVDDLARRTLLRIIDRRFVDFFFYLHVGGLPEGFMAFFCFVFHLAHGAWEKKCD